jgi:hypothetical protein
MTKRSFSIKILILASLSGASFLYTLYFIDPRSGWINIVIFLASLFLLIVSIFSLVNFFFLRKRSNNEGHFDASRGSIRRGILLGIYSLGVLGLASLELLTWWDALLLALSLILFELYFISGREKGL